MDQLLAVSEGQVALNLNKQMSPEQKLNVLETSLFTLLQSQIKTLFTSTELDSTQPPVPATTIEAPKATEAPVPTTVAVENVAESTTVAPTTTEASNTTNFTKDGMEIQSRYPIKYIDPNGRYPLFPLAKNGQWIPKGSPIRQFGSIGPHFLFPNGDTISMNSLSLEQIRSLDARPKN